MRAAIMLAAAMLAACVLLGAAKPESSCPSPDFERERRVEEAGRMAESGDACWWLSSGAVVSMERGTARSLQGPLPAGSPWRELYAESNPADTAEGRHPQNLLRLVTRHRWLDYHQETRFRIARLNLSDSRERGEWSGVFLFVRYLDQDNLYYAGLRMDGTAVIKRKSGGQYATLAQAPVFGKPQDYERQSRPTLLPVGEWLGLAADVASGPEGQARITLYLRDGDAGPWRVVAQAEDAQAGAAVRKPGHGGLRSDFVDVEFAAYTVMPAR